MLVQIFPLNLSVSRFLAQQDGQQEHLEQPRELRMKAAFG